MITVEQGFRRVSRDHEAELPAEIVDVLHTRIGAARAEGRDLVRAVAGEDHPTVPEPLHAAALEGVDRRPDDVVLDRLAQHGVEPAADIVFLELLLAVDVPADLEVDPPHVVRLLVQQRGCTRLEPGLEPEPAFGREALGLHADVGDQEAVAEHLALELETHRLAQRRAGSVAGDQPVCFDRIGAVGREDLERNMVTPDVDRLDAVASAYADQRAFLLLGLNLLEQEFLEIGLLQVDEGGVAMALFGQEIELEDLAVVMEDLAEVPHHALVDHRPAAAVAVGDFQRAFGKADRAASCPDALMVVEHQHGHALPAEIKRHCEADRAAADDHDGMADRRFLVLVGIAPVGIEPEGERIAVLQHVRLLGAGYPCRALHISRSRSAVQIRGVSMPRASS